MPKECGPYPGAPLAGEISVTIESVPGEVMCDYGEPCKPWQCEFVMAEERNEVGCGIEYADGSVLRFDCSNDECHHPVHLETLRRICACVNACRGIEAEGLEALVDGRPWPGLELAEMAKYRERSLARAIYHAARVAENLGISERECENEIGRKKKVT